MLLTEIGVQKARAEKLAKYGLVTTDDVLRTIPEKYMDCRNPIRKFSDLPENGKRLCIAGTVCTKPSLGKGGLVSIMVKDINNQILKVQWFGKPFLMNQLWEGQKLSFFGDVKTVPVFGKSFYPERYGIDGEEFNRIVPKYRDLKDEGIAKDWYINLVKKCLDIEKENLKYEPLELELRKKFGLCTLSEAVYGAHRPNNPQEVSQAKKRFAFDDMFLFCFKVEQTNSGLPTKAPFIAEHWDCFEEILSKLPFELTNGQKTTINSCVRNMKQGKRVNCLVQGDVGSGKTMVALFLSFLAVEHGFQAIVMAPTEILAKQHYKEFVDKAPEKYKDKIRLVLGTETAKARRKTDEELKNGECVIAIGTVALLNREYKNVGMICADEQHRFGVEQRRQLLLNSNPCPHFAEFSATPIPRTIALAKYGKGTDVYIIPEKPPGRIPTITKHVKTQDEAIEVIRKEVIDGHRVYCVCPLVEESDAECMEGILSATEAAELIQHKLRDLPNVEVGLVTGKMKPQEADAEIMRFANGETKVLCATTVIEVGVNVPEATAIVLFNSERFGLAQMHQLRGRVGRGKLHSYCILQTPKDDKKAKIMCSSEDGFLIAEEDRKLRGDGEYIGLKQSGKNKYTELMYKYPNTYSKIATEVYEILGNPSRKKHYEDYAAKVMLHETLEADSEFKPNNKNWNKNEK